MTGGNVSFYNQTGDTNILPTPVIGVLGIIDDVAKRTQMGFAHSGDAVVLLGDTLDELSGSVWAGVIHDHLGGLPPMPNLAAEQALAAVLVGASKQGLVTSAHDLSDGGLAQALVECSLRNGQGVAVTLPDGDPTVTLFSESPARALVSLPASSFAAFEALCAEHGVPQQRIGEVTGDSEIEVVGRFTLDLDEVRRRWQAPLRAAMHA